MGVGLGVKFETNKLYGLPERESSPVIKNTLDTDKVSVLHELRLHVPEQIA